MKEITIEKLQKLEMDQVFTEKVRTAKSAQDLTVVMAEYGIELSAEEIEKGYAKAAELLVQKDYLDNGALSDQELEMVVGGVNAPGFLFGTAVAMGVMAGGPVGVALWLGGMTIMSGSLAF